LASTPDTASFWRRLARSTIARFVGLAFLCQFLVTGGVLLFVQQASQRTVVSAERETTEALRDELLAGYRSGGSKALSAAIGQRLSSTGGDHIAILLATRDGRALAGTLGAWPATVPDNARWRVIDLYRLGRDQPDPLGVTATRLPDGNRLLAGVVLSQRLRLTRIYEEALSMAFLASLGLSLIIAIVQGRLIARQVSGIAETAEDVAVGALDRRVPINGSGDAFDRLGQSINAMLERIDALVSELRIMTDGLAHDLKSPVTRLMSVVEQASARTKDETALDALETVRREAEALQTMLATALLISRTEAGVGAGMMRETDVGDLLRDLAEVYGPLVEESGFTLTVAAPDGLIFPLHRELVSQAIANLIENALKYAEGGNAITLTAAPDADLLITVADNGPGIPASQRDAALKRFGRLDPARGKPGSGLGLSLVEAVARLHHGQMTLGDNGPGLLVALHLKQRG